MRTDITMGYYNIFTAIIFILLNQDASSIFMFMNK